MIDDDGHNLMMYRMNDEFWSMINDPGFTYRTIKKFYNTEQIITNMVQKIPHHAANEIDELSFEY